MKVFRIWRWLWKWRVLELRIPLYPRVFHSCRRETCSDCGVTFWCCEPGSARGSRPDAWCAACMAKKPQARWSP